MVLVWRRERKWKSFEAWYCEYLEEAIVEGRTLVSVQIPGLKRSWKVVDTWNHMEELENLSCGWKETPTFWRFKCHEKPPKPAEVVVWSWPGPERQALCAGEGRTREVTRVLWSPSCLAWIPDFKYITLYIVEACFYFDLFYLFSGFSLLEKESI